MLRVYIDLACGFENEWRESIFCRRSMFAVLTTISLVHFLSDKL
jgi:hypothetical protein